MDQMEENKVTRTQIGIRFIYTLLFLIIFEVLKMVIQVTVLFQFAYLLITREYSAPLRSFSNRVSTYLYKVVRYATMNENGKPFPFTDFPVEVEPAEERVKFD